MKEHYFKCALDNAKEHNELWDTEREYNSGQRKCNAFGVWLECNPVWRKGAITRKIIDLSK